MHAPFSLKYKDNINIPSQIQALHLYSIKKTTFVNVSHIHSLRFHYYVKTTFIYKKSLIIFMFFVFIIK